jgi:HrpA-like RNA helicase
VGSRAARVHTQASTGVLKFYSGTNIIMAFWRPGAAKPDVPVDRELRDAGVAAVVNPLAGASVDVQRRSLPIFSHRREILYAVEMFGVVVIVGETGSGKSTRKYLFLTASQFMQRWYNCCC